MVYRLLFRPDIMSKYYNCSHRTYEEWKALGSPNAAVATTFFTLGIIFWIMFYLGIVDIIQIPVAGFLLGYYAATGMIYCMAPLLLNVSGSLAVGLWTMGSTGCVVLAFNRYIDMVDHNLATRVFAGKRMYFWLSIPTLYGLGVFLFSPPTIWTSKMYALFFDPFVGLPERHGGVDAEHYPYMALSVHNMSIVILLVFAYAGLLIQLAIRSRGVSTVQLNRVQRQTLATAIMICTGTFVAALVYCFMQFIPTPPWVTFIGELGWQFSHGFVGLTYLLMNATMRKEAMRIFCSNKHGAITSTTLHSSHLCDTADHMGI